MKSKLLLLAVSLVLWSMFAFPFAIVSFFDETIAFAMASLTAVYLYLMHRFTKGLVFVLLRLSISILVVLIPRRVFFFRSQATDEFEL